MIWVSEMPFIKKVQESPEKFILAIIYTRENFYLDEVTNKTEDISA